MKWISILAGGLIASGACLAEELPMLQEKPWLGCFVGHEGRGFDFALGADGESEIHFKDGNDRVSSSYAMKVRYVLEEQVDGKWVRRKIAEDGFETTQEPTDEPESVAFSATYTGDTRVGITHAFDKGEVLIGTKILAKTTTNPIRCGVEVVVPDLHRGVKEKEVSKRDLKAEVKDTEMGGETLKGDEVEVELEELPKLDGKEFFGEGAKRISVESERFGGREVALSLVEDGTGRIEVNQRKAALHGFDLLWWPDPAKAGTPGARLRVAIK